MEIDSSFINSATTCNMMAFMRFYHGLIDSSHACHFEYIGKVYKHEKTKHQYDDAYKLEI